MHLCVLEVVSLFLIVIAFVMVFRCLAVPIRLCVFVENFRVSLICIYINLCIRKCASELG